MCVCVCVCICVCGVYMCCVCVLRGAVMCVCVCVRVHVCVQLCMILLTMSAGDFPVPVQLCVTRNVSKAPVWQTTRVGVEMVTMETSAL